MSALPCEYEVLAEGYKAISGKRYHASDCATSCAPAEKPGPCDCDLDLDIEIARQVLADYKGGLFDEPDATNPRGYVTRYHPLVAMRKALCAARLVQVSA